MEFGARLNRYLSYATPMLLYATWSSYWQVVDWIDPHLIPFPTAFDRHCSQTIPHQLSIATLLTPSPCRIRQGLRRLSQAHWQARGPQVGRHCQDWHLQGACSL